MAPVASGAVQEIWQYPVKSMGGQRVASATLIDRGVAEDRQWAVRDTTASEIVGAKRIPVLLECSARYVDDRAGTVSITLPGGEQVTSDELEVANEALSRLCGRAVTLERLRPAEEADFYRHGPRSPDRPRPSLREILGLEAGDPIPDLSGLPRELSLFATPPGAFYDAYPVHIISTTSLATLRRMAPGVDFDVQRFRPSFVVDMEDTAEAFPELGWVGSSLRAGDTRLAVTAPCVRCSMVMHPRSGLGRERAALRTLVKETQQVLGVYCTVERGGVIEPEARVTVND